MTPHTAFVWLGAIPDFTVAPPANAVRDPYLAATMAAVFGAPSPEERAAMDRIEAEDWHDAHADRWDEKHSRAEERARMREEMDQ